MSSINNFVTFLKTMPGGAEAGPDSSNAPALTEQDRKVLGLVDTANLLATPDLVTVAKITPEQALESVERLRRLNQLEVVQGA